MVLSKSQKFGTEKDSDSLSQHGLCLLIHMQFNGQLKKQKGSVLYMHLINGNMRAGLSASRCWSSATRWQDGSRDRARVRTEIKGKNSAMTGTPLEKAQVTISPKGQSIPDLSHTPTDNKRQRKIPGMQVGPVNQRSPHYFKHSLTILGRDWPTPF